MAKGAIAPASSDAHADDPDAQATEQPVATKAPGVLARQIDRRWQQTLVYLRLGVKLSRECLD